MSEAIAATGAMDRAPSSLSDLNERRGLWKTWGVWRGTMTALILLAPRTGSDGQFSYDRPRDGVSASAFG